MEPLSHLIFFGVGLHWVFDLEVAIDLSHLRFCMRMRRRAWRETCSQYCFRFACERYPDPTICMRSHPSQTMIKLQYRKFENHSQVRANVGPSIIPSALVHLTGVPVCTVAQNLKSAAYLWTQWTKDFSTWIWSNSVSSESWRTPKPNMYCTALRSGHRMAHIVVVPWLQTWCDPYFSTWQLYFVAEMCSLEVCWSLELHQHSLRFGLGFVLLVRTLHANVVAHACLCLLVTASVWRLSCWVFLLVERNTLHLNNTLFQRACRRARIWFGQRRPLAATCGHLRPLAATCGHLRPLALAATCSGGHLRPLDWLQVAASGCRWKENAGGHWRPLAATRVAASGCKWLPLRKECWRTLADTGGHWRPLDWLQVAASGCQWEENAGGQSPSKQTIKQPASQPASQQASRQGRKQASKHASKPASKKKNTKSNRAKEPKDQRAKEQKSTIK